MSPKKQNTKKREVTLDPDDWDKTRSLGHLMLDDMMTYLQTIETKPTRLPTKEAIKKNLHATLRLWGR
jgi:hypothetical protein